MKEWKLRQIIYHKTAPIDDIQSNYQVMENFTDDIMINSICEYFTKPIDYLLYPAKSYAVAIIYATLLEQHFRENFYEVLNDPQLLYDNDRFFVPYNVAKNTYDSVLTRIDRMHLNTNLPQIKTTINYFNAEFLLSSSIPTHE